MAQYQPTPQTGAEPPLDWPWYGIGFGAAVKRFFKKYATFNGRASRGEYWWVTLFNVLVAVVLNAFMLPGLISASTAASTGVAPELGAGYYAATGLASLWSLVILVPSIAVAVRRLHDTGRSGWFYLLGLIPLVGPIILIVFFASATSSTAERYGPPSAQGGFGGYGQETYPPAQGYTA